MLVFVAIFLFLLVVVGCCIGPLHTTGEPVEVVPGTAFQRAIESLPWHQQELIRLGSKHEEVRK